MGGNHGFTSKVLPYETSTHLPFLLPDQDLAVLKVNTGSKLDIDIAQTIPDLAGILVPENIYGRSIFPLTFGKPDEY